MKRTFQVGEKSIHSGPRSKDESIANLVNTKDVNVVMSTISNFNQTGIDKKDYASDTKYKIKAADVISEIENAIDIHNMRTPELPDNSVENLHHTQRANLPTGNDNAILLQENASNRTDGLFD